MLVRTLCAVPAFLVVLGVSEVRAQDENPVIPLIKSKVKDTTKPFALSVEFKVKAGKEKEFEEAFKPCLAATRKEPGCVAYFLNRDPDHPEIYVMYEQFKSLDAVRDHLKAKHTGRPVQGDHSASRRGAKGEGAPGAGVKSPGLTSGANCLTSAADHRSRAACGGTGRRSRWWT